MKYCWRLRAKLDESFESYLNRIFYLFAQRSVVEVSHYVFSFWRNVHSRKLYFKHPIPSSRFCFPLIGCQSILASKTHFSSTFVLFLPSSHDLELFQTLEADEQKSFNISKTLKTIICKGKHTNIFTSLSTSKLALHKSESSSSCINIGGERDLSVRLRLNKLIFNLLPFV